MLSFTELPDVDETIQVVTYVTAVGDVSTDLLSPGSDAHSRSDRELHGQCLFEHNKSAQKVLLDLKHNIQTSASCSSLKKARWVSVRHECWCE